MANDIHSYSHLATLTLEQLHLDLHLGVTEDEQRTPQKVLIFLTLFFPELPQACINDSLEDTVCYHKLCTEIHNYCTGKTFKLIEYLGYQLYLVARKITPPSVKIHITVEKCNPPIEYLHGSALFTYTDLKDC